MDFLDTFKLTLYATEIFVFTPKGEIKTLPSGSTALDFAFEIHSDIGMRCIGAKVNNKLVPLSYELQSGDQIEILTSKQQTPQPEWLSYVTTARAKQKLNLLFKNEQKIVKAEGETILRKALTEAGFVIKKDISNDIIKKLLHHFEINSFEELTFQIGKGSISLANIQDIVKQENKNHRAFVVSSLLLWQRYG